MDILNLFPQHLRDTDRYPFVRATSDVLRVVVAMYYREIADSIKELYSIDGKYYEDNLDKFTKRSGLAKENLDRLIESFLPFASSFINDTSYENKRGVLSFADAFFSTKGTLDGLRALAAFLNLPLSIYTREGNSGASEFYGSAGEIQLESSDGPRCELMPENGSEAGETRYVYEYFPASWDVVIGGQLITYPTADGEIVFRSRNLTDNVFEVDLRGFIKVEAGKSYSYLVGSDDGSYIEFGENGELAKSWVPCDVVYLNSPQDQFDRADWTKEDSWITPAELIGTGRLTGHAFCWGNQWAEWTAEEDGYVPFRIRKINDNGGPAFFKVIGGETQKIRGSVASTMTFGGTTFVGGYNNLPKFPFRNLMLSDGQKIVSGDDFCLAVPGFTSDDGNRIASYCNYLEQDSFLRRREKRIDPAGLLDSYDIVISINITDLRKVYDIDKANADSWKYYNKSLQKRVEEMVKEFTWVCSNIIAYLFYIAQNNVLVESTANLQTQYVFQEKTTDASIRRLVTPTIQDKSSMTVVRAKPPAGYKGVATGSLDYQYLESNYQQTTRFDETRKWFGVSSIKGGKVPADKNVDNPGVQNLRTVVKPTTGNIFKEAENKLLVFLRGGVYTGTGPNWYMSNPAAKEWITNDLVRGGVSNVPANTAYERYALTLANSTTGAPYLSRTATMGYGVDYSYEGSNSRYPANICVVDKLKVRLNKA